MIDYEQPDFYRFNEDSLTLVNWVSEKKPLCASLLDLGAGSGVIGIELANRLNSPHLTFLEAQADFIPFLQKNIKEQLKVPAVTACIQASFGEWKPQSQYDLIVCNPPYYLKDHGQPSSDERRNIARTFILDDWKTLTTLIRTALAPHGRACLVLKNDKKIVKEAQSNLKGLESKIFEVEKLIMLELSLTEYISKSSSP